MPYDCRAVANAVLDLADRHGLRLTHMAIHKVMYYAHGWHLAATGEPLIAQEFEAWRDGPVQGIVWDCFKHFRSAVVTDRATRLDLVTRERTVVRQEIAPSDLALLDKIVVGYGHIDTRELSWMTHEKNGPWDQIWNKPGGRITLGMRITHASIRDRFRSQLPAAGEGALAAK